MGLLHAGECQDRQGSCSSQGVHPCPLLRQSQSKGVGELRWGWLCTRMQEWRESPFQQRRLLLRTLLKYIIQHQNAICRCACVPGCAAPHNICEFLQASRRCNCLPCCRVAARDSGKPMVDAAFGEVMVTCEKIAWLLRHGERWLRPERRSPGVMVGP